MTRLNWIVRIVFILFFFSSTLFAQKTIEEKIDSVNATPYSFIVSNARKSIQIFSDNLNKAQEIQYLKGVAFSNSNLALAYYIDGQYDKSASAFLNATNKFDELGLTKEKAATLGEFGYQIKRSDLSKAIKYMKEGIKIAEANQYDYVLAKLYDNYGVLQEMEGKLDSAMYFYNKSLNKKVAHQDSIGIPYSLNKIAGIHAMQNDIKEALKIMSQSDTYRNKEEGEFGRIENLVLYGDIYKTGGNLERAVGYYERGLEKSIKNNINYLIRYCYQQLTELYKLQGEYQKAYDALNSFIAYKDSVLNKDVQVKVAELEIDYETEKKDRQIAENKLEISEKTSQLYLLIGFAFLMVFALFVIYVYQKRKREKLILENKLRQVELENKLTEEKLRISRELHDNIGSQLTFMISSVDNFVLKSKQNPDMLNNISEFGRDALGELRNTIWALKQEDAEFYELIIKINELVRKINSTIDNIKIKVENSITKKISLTTVQILNLYRVVQEAVQNSIKHSCASEVKIEFSNPNNMLQLDISDNGKGFDIENVTAGNGLESMKKRCEDCGGELEISSSSSGTLIECIIKIN